VGGKPSDLRGKDDTNVPGKGDKKHSKEGKKGGRQRDVEGGRADKTTYIEGVAFEGPRKRGRHRLQARLTGVYVIV